MGELDEYRHLWDGTEPGWTVCRVHDTRWTATYTFSADGPTLKEVASLRQLLDEFRNLPVNGVWQQLHGVTQYQAKGTMGNIEAHERSLKAEKLGLRVELTSKDEGGCIPISPDGRAVIIEDDDLGAKVVERMLEAGVPVKEVFPD